MLETIGYDAATAASFAPWDAADASVGRVARVDRGVLTVLTEAGPHRVTLGGPVLALAAQDPAHAPCVGDWVVVRCWPDRRETVEHVLPRRTSLPGYGDKAGSGVVMAANVDLVGVVAELRPEPRPEPRTRAELARLLDLAAAGRTTPLVLLVLTEGGADVDLPSPARGVAADRGVEVVLLDPQRGQGLPRLRELLDGRRTLALVGTSGRVTGRLARALVGADVLANGRCGRGLTPLPTGGAVLDLAHPSAPSLGGWTSQGVR